MIPTSILRIWFLGLLSLAIVAGAIFLGNRWQQRSWDWDAVNKRSVFAPHFGENEETALLAGAAVLCLAAVAGGPLCKTAMRLTLRKRPEGEADPRDAATPTSRKRLERPDGSTLQIETYGSENSIPIVLTHGWGLNSREWNYLKRELSDKFRLITWDLPGLGDSTRPKNGDYGLDNLAADLDAVLAATCNRPAILLGHSIGGMITLTFCRLFSTEMESRVAGLVLTHTTPTDPVRTTSGASFLTAIESPVLVPLMYLTIALSPLVWLMNWLSYWNGSAHLSTKRSSFAGSETWEQVDFAARFQPIASPAVLARGMLGMMRYDALSSLANIPVPALIVAGNKDSTTKPQASDMMRAGIPGARIETLAPAKHLGLIEHHKQYATLVREFADAVRPPALARGVAQSA